MKTGASLKNRQGGAVAVMVGISMVMLIGFLALVIDLGHLYLAKTGLQNAADAAALSGAKQLDGTADGICCDDGTAGTKLSAVYMAVTTGGSNSFFGNLGQEQVNLGGAKDSSNPNIRFSRDPNGSEGTAGNWGLSIADAKSNPGGIYFVRVDTGSKSLSTWFAVIWNILNTNTKAVAVAGRGETPIAPIGVCAIDNINETQYISEDGTSWPKYLVEWGFRRGTSYGFGTINTVVGAPSGFASGAALYLHPTATSGDECSPIDVVPFLCRGTSAINGNKGSIVYENTGLNTGKAISALNTRFNVYDSSITGGGGMSLAELQASCPPDIDITKYTPGAAAGWMSVAPFDQNVSAGSNAADKNKNLAAWQAGMNVISFDDIKVRAEKDGGCVDKPGDPPDCNNNYGVLWSNSRPLKKMTSDTDTPVPAVPTDWTNLYREGPMHPAGTWVPQYSGNQRRIINVVIVDCYAPIGVGCQGVTVLGIGEFFLQTTAINNNIYGEFSRLLPQPLPPAKIRLYR